jgi:hypothetical protein
MDEPTKDVVIRQQELIIRDYQATINTQHLELAQHRERERYIDGERWGFALWLMFHDLWPFSMWYQP